MKPENLDGNWEEGPQEGSYRIFRVGPVIVRGFNDLEEDGELVTDERVTVHLERMNDCHWWLGLSWGDDGDRHTVAVDLHSKRAIKVQWREDY